MSKSRKYNQATKLISTWEELSKCESETHRLFINFVAGNGWIDSKANEPGTNSCVDSHYLSTHTFYEKHHEESTRLLQSCGFNVKIVNRDAERLDGGKK